MMTKLEMAAKLRECAQWVRDHGFVKYTRFQSPYQRCALGVMEGVMGFGGESTLIESVAPELVAVVARPLPQGYPASPPARIAIWNNAPERTASDLIEHFDGVALQLEIEVLAEETPATEEAPVTEEEGEPEKEVVPV